MKREFLDYLEDIIQAMESAIKFTEDMNYSKSGALN
jgi:uncharacterized protein with HEPN domain